MIGGGEAQPARSSATSSTSRRCSSLRSSPMRNAERRGDACSSRSTCLGALALSRGLLPGTDGDDGVLLRLRHVVGVRACGFQQRTSGGIAGLLARADRRGAARAGASPYDVAACPRSSRSSRSPSCSRREPRSTQPTASRRTGLCARSGRPRPTGSTACTWGRRTISRSPARIRLLGTLSRELEPNRQRRDRARHCCAGHAPPPCRASRATTARSRSPANAPRSTSSSSTSPGPRSASKDSVVARPRDGPGRLPRTGRRARPLARHAAWRRTAGPGRPLRYRAWPRRAGVYELNLSLPEDHCRGRCIARRQAVQNRAVIAAATTPLRFRRRRTDSNSVRRRPRTPARRDEFSA